MRGPFEETAPAGRARAEASVGEAGGRRREAAFCEGFFSKLNHSL